MSSQESAPSPFPSRPLTGMLQCAHWRVYSRVCSIAEGARTAHSFRWRQISLLPTIFAWYPRAVDRSSTALADRLLIQVARPSCHRLPALDVDSPWSRRMTLPGRTLLRWGPRYAVGISSVHFDPLGVVVHSRICPFVDFCRVPSTSSTGQAACCLPRLVR